MRTARIGWVLAVPRRPASARAEARAVESAGTYAGDGSCGVLFDGYLYDRAELMKGPLAGQNGARAIPGWCSRPTDATAKEWSRA